MTSFIALADELARAIGEGRLQAGERLPPQRAYADRRGIAISTASRVYAELIRRGLVTGEVGRGTFVRNASPNPDLALTQVASEPVDLELNVAVLPGQAARMLHALSALHHREGLERALLPVGPTVNGLFRRHASRLLSRAGWSPDPDAILVCGSGKQSIAAALASVARAGDRVGVEALTYPVTKAIAVQLGITLVPIGMDDEGLEPQALARAHRNASLKAVYLQPSLQNPLGSCMSAARKRAIAEVLSACGIVAIEDAVYAFLAGEKPLAAFAPEHVILVDSLSKRVAPGLSVGFIVPPARWKEEVSRALLSGAWNASGFAVAAVSQLMADRCIEEIQSSKRADAARRQAVARKLLRDVDVRGDARSYHLWLELPEPWRAEQFVSAAARRGIAILPASVFAVGAGHAPNAVRLALAAPPLAIVEDALATLAELLRTGGHRLLE